MFYNMKNVSAETYYRKMFISVYIQHISDALLYKLLPQSDFDCKALRFLCKEILTEVILLPLLNLVSDPDYVNQTIIWLVGIVSIIFCLFFSNIDNSMIFYGTILKLIFVSIVQRFFSYK